MDIFSSWKRTIRYWFRTWKIMFTVQKYAENEFLTRTLIILTYSKRILIWRETGTVYTMHKYIANIHQKNRTHTCLKSNETDIIRVRTHTHTYTNNTKHRTTALHPFIFTAWNGTWNGTEAHAHFGNWLTLTENIDFCHWIS